ncbi:hypothetical protein IDH28_00270 [Pelagibacterales bacterium SAG-MED31]|nr:hypothetical protein [Pelagibacterales bacterium SAG-MED31]
MIETLIVGSGFSALCSYLLLKESNLKILDCTRIKNETKLIRRDNLNINKFFSDNSISYGNFHYELNSKTKIHDRLISGGNTNIWGGFIDIKEVSENYIKILKEHSITFHNLDLDINGYKTNNSSIRQLRDKDNNILNSKKFLKNCISGYLYSFKVEKDKIVTQIFNEKENKFTFLNTKKIILAVGFPQLIDLLFRSGFLDGLKTLSMNEYNHRFILNFSKKLNNLNIGDCVIKYDLIRSIKHFLGYQNSLDKIKFPFPIYIDQFFANNKKFLELKLNCSLKKIIQPENNLKFGDSIHYCNLFIDNMNINDYLLNISKNIIGIGMPFLEQKKPGPISNDIMNDTYMKV